MAVVANQAVAFDKSMLTACRHLVHLGVSSAHLRACHEQPVNWVTGHGALGLHGATVGLPTMHSELRRLQGHATWRVAEARFASASGVGISEKRLRESGPM